MTKTLDLVYHVWTASIVDFEATYREVAEAGARSIVVTQKRGELDMTARDDVAKAKGILARLGLKARACHGLDTAGYDLNEAKEDLRPRLIAGHVNFMESAAELGCRTYVCHLGYPAPGDSRDASRRRVLRTLDELAPRAQALGLVIALENGLPGYAATVPELLALVSEYGNPAVGICYDSGHAHIADDAGAALKTLSPHVATVHLHDNDGKGDQHLLPGEGTVDWKAVVAALSQCPRLVHVETEAANSAAWKPSKPVRPHREVYELYCQILNTPESGLICR